MFVEFTFPYEFMSEKTKEKDLLIYQKLHPQIFGMAKDPEKFERWKTYVGDMDLLMSVFDEVAVRGIMNKDDIMGAINKLTHRLINHSKIFNAKCAVHVPGNSLLEINETLLLENACTDFLQQHLDDGWRIIAACPQPNQRRPDYVLGRTT
jgi:hypothetical protein